MSVLIKTKEASFPVGSVPSLSSPSTGKDKLPSDVATLVQLHAALAAIEDGDQDSSTTAPTLEQLANSTSSTDMQLAMSKLAGILTALEQALLKYQQETGDMQADVGNLYVKNAQETLQKAQAAYEQYQAELEAQQHESLWQKILGIVLTVVSVVAACFMGPEMLIMTAALVTLQYSGGLNDLTNAIANGLAQVMPPSIAKIVADVITTLVIVVASAGVGGVGAASSAASTAETAVNTAARTGEEVADEAATALEDVASDADSITCVAEEFEATEEATVSSTKVTQTFDKFVEGSSKALSKLKALFGRMSTNGAAFAKMFGVMGALQTNLPGDVAKACGANEEVAAIINGVIGFIGAIYCAKVGFTETSTVGWGAAANAAASAASTVGKTLGELLPSFVEEMLTTFGKYIQSAQFATLAKTMGLVAQGSALIGEVGVNVASYRTNIDLSNTEADLATTQASLAFYETLEKLSSTINQQMEAAISASVSDVAQQINSVTASFLKPLAAEIAILQK